uniref:Uncharacterized protein n=1 Tax=Meloidogyne enterolobii TaxID=390850 RepID=A0A6V7V7B1_MELEN|nr:unnamed protein product [Meloidogyne enterolobii]
MLYPSKINAVHLLLFYVNLLLPFLSDGIEPNIDKLKGEFDCFSSEVLNNKVVSDGVYSDKGDEFYAIAPNNNKNIIFQININKYREDSPSLKGEKQVDAKFEKEGILLNVSSCENKTRKIFSHNCFTSKEDIKCKYLKTKDEMECNTTFTMTCEIDYKQIEGKQYGLLTFKIQRKEEEPCIVQFSTNEQNETITTNIQTSKSIYTSPPSIPSSTVIVSSKPTKKELSFSDCLTDIILIILVVILILLLPIILFLIFYKPKPVKVVGKEDETTIVVEDGMTEGSVGMTGSIKTKQEKEHGKFMAVKTIALESDQADSAEDLGQTGLTNIADNSEISERPEKVQHNEEEDKKSEARGVGTDTEQHNEEQRRSRDGVEVPETIIHTPMEHGGVEQGVEVPLYEEM